MNLKHLFARLLALTVLVTGAHDVYAIGDSGGCSIDSQYARVLSNGSVSDIESHIASALTRSAEYLPLPQKVAFLSNPASLKAWRAEARLRMIHGQMVCGLDFPLDYAVGHGNLDVVQWLLDVGVDPNATSADLKRNVFTRCRFGGYGTPAGMSREQAQERRHQAYLMLLARGAKINALDPFHAIYGCLDGESYAFFKQLGAVVTKEAFESQVRGARAAGGPVYETRWAAVVELAKGQAFDFRGTSFEEGLVFMLQARAGMPDYNSVVDLTRRLSTVVRLSPGVVPGQRARPEDVPGNFAPRREGCYFPEVGAYPNFEFQALWRDAASGQNTSSTPDTTEVRVGRTQTPLLLVLVNNRAVPTTWKVSRSNDAHLLGVMVLSNSLKGRGGKDVLSFDPTRPAFLGDSYRCTVLVLSQADGFPRSELKPVQLPDPNARTYNPFQLRGAPSISVSQGNQFVVGEITSSSVMTSWSDIRREATPAVKN